MRCEVSVCVIDMMCPHLYREREGVHPSTSSLPPSLPPSPAPVLLSLAGAEVEAPVLPHSWGFLSAPALCLTLTGLTPRQV